MRPRGTHRGWERIPGGQRDEKGHWEERGPTETGVPCREEHGAEDTGRGVPGNHLSGSWRRSHDPN